MTASPRPGNRRRPERSSRSGQFRERLFGSIALLYRVDALFSLDDLLG